MMEFKLKPQMYFNDTKNKKIDLNQIYNWSLETLLSKIWLEKEWNVCAKGGFWPNNPKFSSYNDMPMLAHILSGIGLSLKVIELALNENLNELINIDDDELVKKIKRSILGFVFHDYNKVVQSSYKMNDKNDFYKTNMGDIEDILNELNLTKDDLYQIAISTEYSTSFNVFRENFNLNENLVFEQRFSKIADQLSSIFNSDDPDLNNLNISFFGFSFENTKIHRIKFASTIYYTFTDLVKKEIIDLLKNNNNVYLWSTQDSIYYYGKKFNIFENYEIIAESAYKEFIKRIHNAQMVNFNDRRISIPLKGILPINIDMINKILINNDIFKNILYMENKNADLTDSNTIMQYQEKVNEILKSLKFSFNKELEFRNSYNLDEINIEDEEKLTERLKIFIARFAQLENNCKGKNIGVIRNKINETLNDPLLQPFVKKISKQNKFKNSFVIPLLLGIKDLDRIWGQAMQEILDYYNENRIDVKSNIKSIVSIILGIFPKEFPQVPEKNKMSLVNGYPGSIRALAENMYGLATNQTFTNRIITSTVPNAIIDENYLLESLLRNSVIPRNPLKISKSIGSSIVYLSFPGAIPYIDLDELFNKVVKINKNSKKELEFNEINEIYVGMDQDVYSRNLVIDNSFILSVEDIPDNKTALKILYEIILLAKFTKMKILLTDSHSPPIKFQKELIRVDTSFFILKDLKMEKIRCNQIDENLEFLNLINLLVSKSFGKKNFDEMVKVLNDYLKEPLSIFSYLMMKINNSNIKSLNLEKLFGNKLTENIEKIESLVNYGQKYRKNIRGDKIMDDLKDLAKTAVELKKPGYSSSQRTWMVRDSLEALEKWISSDKSGMNQDIEKLKEVIEGVIYKGVKDEYGVTPEKVENFALALINFLKHHFNGKIPSGSLKSYFIDAFEFEYLVEYQNYSKSKEV